MLLKIFAEVFDRALDRFDGARSEGAERIARAEQPAMAFEILDVAGLAAALFESVQNLFEPGQAIAAGCAPAAGFARKELR